MPSKLRGLQARPPGAEVLKYLIGLAPSIEDEMQSWPLGRGPASGLAQGHAFPLHYSIPSPSKCFHSFTLWPCRPLGAQMSSRKDFFLDCGGECRKEKPQEKRWFCEFDTWKRLPDKIWSRCVCWELCRGLQSMFGVLPQDEWWILRSLGTQT